MSPHADYPNGAAIGNAQLMLDVIITISGLKSPIASVGEPMVNTAGCPSVAAKIIELLLSERLDPLCWHFTHLKSQEVSKDRILLLTVIFGRHNRSRVKPKWRKHALERLTQG